MGSGYRNDAQVTVRAVALLIRVSRGDLPNDVLTIHVDLTRPVTRLIGRGAGQLPIPVPFRRSEGRGTLNSGRQFFARVAPFCQKLPETGETDEFLQALVQMHYLQLAVRSLRRDIQSNNRPQPGAV